MIFFTSSIVSYHIKILIVNFAVYLFIASRVSSSGGKLPPPPPPPPKKKGREKEEKRERLEKKERDVPIVVFQGGMLSESEGLRL